ncbi:glucose 1-dehydrogenase [Mycobacterium sp.]|uniref:glucose 1-dehydrogenase n=1 Tax=Mycobacterium sp. TaxID=1785 RepID=UPI003BAC762E
MAGRLAGKVALISGGARGMGAAHMRALADEGAMVVAGDVLDDEGAALTAELNESALYVHLDVTDPGDWEGAVVSTVERFGRLDVLINNAGILNYGPLEDFDIAEWHRIIEINLTGVFLGMRAVIKAMDATGGGSIINISSIDGLNGSPGAVGYVASKWGVRGLTKCAALELASRNIRVNSVHPGLIRTPMIDGFPEDVFNIPMRRAGDPMEVSKMVVYLASDDSAYSTGSEFVVDGGVAAGLAHRDDLFELNHAGTG